MKNNVISTVIFLTGFICAPLWAEAPDWVSLYQQGKMSEISGTTFYTGVGESSESLEEADRNARVSFAKNVETRVESSLQEVYSEEEGKASTSMEITLDVKTDLSLKGISITEQYTDLEQGIYYSLISINREDYLLILEQNITEEVTHNLAELERERLEMEHERMLQEQELEKERMLREQELEKERIAMEELRLQREKELQEIALEEQRKELLRARYGTYMERTPYPSLLTFENAEVYVGRQHITTSFVLDEEFSLRKVGYALTFFKLFQIGTNHIIDVKQNPSLVYSDLDLKITLLKNKGSAIGVSLALGARAYALYPTAGEGGDPATSANGTLYVTTDVSVPQLYYMDFSLYAGLDRLALGVAWYPLFPLDFFRDSIGLLCDVSYDFRPDFRYGATDMAFRVQPGLQFKPADRVCTRISWEDNFQTFVLSMDVNLGKIRE